MQGLYTLTRDITNPRCEKDRRKRDWIHAPVFLAGWTFKIEKTTGIDWYRMWCCASGFDARRSGTDHDELFSTIMEHLVPANHKACGDTQRGVNDG